MPVVWLRGSALLLAVYQAGLHGRPTAGLGHRRGRQASAGQCAAARGRLSSPAQPIA